MGKGAPAELAVEKLKCHVKQLVGKLQEIQRKAGTKHTLNRAMFEMQYKGYESEENGLAEVSSGCGVEIARYMEVGQ